jgi:hypothetical protein
MSHGAHNTKVELASASNESRAFVSLSTAFVPFLFKDEEVEVEAAATNWRQPRVNDCELSILLWVVAATCDRAEGLTGSCGPWSDISYMGQQPEGTSGNTRARS